MSMGGKWPGRAWLLLLAATPSGWAGTRHGLTTYGEPCVDSCQQRGFPYAWCHKKPSWNGTFLSKFNSTRFPTTWVPLLAPTYLCSDQIVTTAPRSLAKLGIWKRV